MSEQEVFLTEFLPEGNVRHQPRTTLVGIFTELERAEEEILKIYVDVAEIFWKGIDVHWVDKPKGRFLISNDGRFTFGRIRTLTVDSKVDTIQAIW